MIEYRVVQGDELVAHVFGRDPAAVRINLFRVLEQLEGALVFQKINGEWRQVDDYRTLAH